jgi:hypothetical protein
MKASAVVALLALSACSLDVRPEMAYASEAPQAGGEPEALVILGSVDDRRPDGEVVGRAGSAPRVRYLVPEETATAWVVEALREELGRAGARAIPGDASEGWVLRAWLGGLRYRVMPFQIRGMIVLELELLKDGRRVFRKIYARPGESSAGTCAGTLNEALRLALLHAVPEILAAIRSAT